MTRMLPILATLLLTSGAALAQNAHPAPSGGSGAAAPATDEFVKEASAGSRFEIEAGRVAAAQGKDRQIKQFGQRMVKDHGKASKSLEATLKSDKGANLAPADGLLPEQQQKLDALKQARDADFDKLYAKTMVEDHQEDVGKFQAYVQGGDDPKVKAFAKKTLPVLKMHLSMITRLNTKLNGNAAN
jgi:putative membrane protein